jgi:aspartate/methionine/tyrosine aminotransferase
VSDDTSRKSPATADRVNAAPLALSQTAGGIRASVFADLAPRIAARAREGSSLVALHIGDTCLEPPTRARFDLAAHSASGAFDSSLYGYGAIAGTPELRDACAAWLARADREGRGGAPVDPSREILLGSGATHALFCAARALLDPGDEVLLAAPYWPLAHGIVHAAGARAIEVPLTDKLYADRSIDAGALFEAAITPRTRAIYLITPNNPDGKVLTRKDLESIARVARERGLWVIADEVYADYAYDLAHVSMASLEGMRERTVTAYSFSKSHALAGARVGFVVAPERVTALAQRVSTHTVFNVPVIAQRTATLAMVEGDAWVAAAKVEYRAARDAAAAALLGSPARFSLAEGGSYLFLDFAELLGARPLKVLLERAIDEGVLLAPGEAFGKGYEKCARMCFTSVPRPALLDGVRRLRRAMDAIA